MGGLHSLCHNLDQVAAQLVQVEFRLEGRPKGRNGAVSIILAAIEAAINPMRVRISNVVTISERCLRLPKIRYTF